MNIREKYNNKPTLKTKKNNKVYFHLSDGDDESGEERDTESLTKAGASNKMGLVFASAFNVGLFCISILAWLTIYLGFVPSITEQNTLSHKLKSTETSHNDCVIQQAALQGDYSDIKRQKVALSDVNSRLRSEIENLNSQLKVKDESIEYLKSEFRSCQQRYEICSTQLDKANNIAVVLIKRNKVLEKERKEYSTELEQRRKDVEVLLTELSDMHYKFSNYSESVHTLKDFEKATVPDHVPIINVSTESTSVFNQTENNFNSTDLFTKD